MGEGGGVEGMLCDLEGEVEGVVFEPGLVEAKEVSLGVGVVDPDLLGDEALEEIVGLVLLPGDLHSLDVVEDAFEFVEADEAGVVPAAQPQRRFDLVVLLQPQPLPSP
jgi:hypothetical protein